MVTGVVFLVPRAVTAWDRNRWGFDVLAGCGAAPRALDLSAVLGASPSDFPAGDDAERPATLEEFARFVRAERGSSVFVDYLRGISGPDLATVPVFRAMRDAGVLYYVVAAGSLPAAPVTPRRWLRVLTRPARAAGHMRSLLSRALAERFGGYAPPWKIFGPRAPVVAAFAARHGIPPERVIGTNSLDYDLLSRAGSRPPSPSLCCVFVDDGLAGHPDLSAPGRRAVDPEPYFAALRRVFDRVEALSGYPVVVAAHPRSEAIRPDVIGGRRVVRGQTAEAIGSSVLVLGHASTALGLAILARKPLLLLGGRHVAAAGLGGAVAALADMVGAPVVDPEDAGALAALGPGLPAVQEERYAAYVERHVRARDAEQGSLWEVVARHAVADLGRGRTA